MTETLAIRSFVDIRAFAENVEITPARGEASWLTSRVELPRSQTPLTVTAAAFDGAHGTVDALADDEVVIVVRGELTIASDRETLTLPAGRSAALPAGSSFRWQSDGQTRAIIVGHPAHSGGADAPVAIDLEAPLAPSNPPLRELLVGDDEPACRSHNDYKSADGFFYAGTWDSTPYHRVPMTYGHAELMQILDGEVTFVDGAGSAFTARRGDIVLVERGADCSWESRTHVKKMYVIYRPT